jgi:ATP-dependent DNA ligase
VRNQKEHEDQGRIIEPMLALAVTKLPEGSAWSYELKFDGYRALGANANGRVRLLSRNGKDFTSRFASIARALEALPDETVIDGEIIAYDTDGRPSFNVLQNRRGTHRELHLYAFDLLTLRGESLIREPLERRRELLRTEVMPLLPDSIRYSETMETSLVKLIQAVREQGFKGIVAKRRDSAYKPGQRSAAWQKMRVLQRRDFVIGGYTPAGRNFGAILIGDYEGRRSSMPPRSTAASRRRYARPCSSAFRDSKPIPARSRICRRLVAVSGAKD